MVIIPSCVYEVEETRVWGRESSKDTDQLCDVEWQGSVQYTIIVIVLQ